MYLYEGERQVITDKKPMLDVILNKGDIIYIPKNIVHQATSLSKRLSISFPMTKDLDVPPQTREWINICCNN
jgi:ribosomal protein L16 Arg81 hydroxylase